MLALLVCALFVAAQRTSAQDEASYPRVDGKNLLALEASPYLQLHAHNPVDWYPWGELALARAKAEQKPIFLSVGYSTCYWCHVMERNVFSDPDIAAYMNEHFISIKVDREERPDLDDIYMKATHLLNGSGGWPNSVFLTPDRQPFYAGTYFPPEDSRGRPGFPRVLRGLHDAWTNEREKVLTTARAVTERLARLADAGVARSSEPAPPGESMRRALEKLGANFDREHGGFGRRTKFPRPPTLELFLVRLESAPDPDVEAMLTNTLDAMAFGGIYDHLAGGFHRYSTERTWSIPHFEKMLYDNAQLVDAYARAYALTKRPLYRGVVERTVSYLDREMSHPEGGFYSAQDAEVDGEEGASYVWKRDEIEQALGPERATAFFSLYELAPMPEDPSAGVLRVRPLPPSESKNLSARLDEFEVDRAGLLSLRERRKQPLRDDKVLAAWNGLAIRGLVQAAGALDRPDYLHRAERAADFVLDRLLAEDGTLRRSYVAGQARESGVLDDYAMLADGLLTLHEATGEERWLTRARALCDVLIARFEDPIGGGFFLTPSDSDLLVRPKPFEDNAIPSGNAVALRALRKLGAATGSTKYQEAAELIAAAAAPLILRAPSAVPATIAALEPLPRPSRVMGPSLPRSRDFVRASATHAGADTSPVLVRLVIDEGWHVNANPASLPFLIPTKVEGAGGEALYPEGHWFRPAFSEDAIRVYQNDVEIPVALPKATRPPTRLSVHVQACDETRCLPPDRIEVTLEERTETAR